MLAPTDMLDRLEDNTLLCRSYQDPLDSPSWRLLNVLFCSHSSKRTRELCWIYSIPRCSGIESRFSFIVCWNALNKEHEPLLWPLHPQLVQYNIQKTFPDIYVSLSEMLPIKYNRRLDADVTTVRM
jgi:hypothetical protein